MPASLPLRITVEQAAMNALRAWLIAGFPTYIYDPITRTDDGVFIDDRWPDADRTLPSRAVTILRAGDPTEASTQPEVDSYRVIHAGVTPRVRLAAPTDVATCITVLNACRSSYGGHRIDTGAHASADTTNVVTAPAATDQGSAETLADNLRDVLARHLVSSAHTTPDVSTALAAVPHVTPGSAPSLISVTTSILNALNAHYPARVYLWRVADVDQPVQLDVWATAEVQRDDLLARLVDLLHVGPDSPAEYLELSLSSADGWAGVTAEVAFNAPTVTDSPDSKKRNEYRATYRGTLTVSRLVTAQSPRMTRAQLLALVGTEAPGAGGHTSTTTASLTGTALVTIVP